MADKPIQATKVGPVKSSSAGDTTKATGASYGPIPGSMGGSTSGWRGPKPQGG